MESKQESESEQRLEVGIEISAGVVAGVPVWRLSRTSTHVRTSRIEVCQRLGANANARATAPDEVRQLEPRFVGTSSQSASPVTLPERVNHVGWFLALVGECFRVFPHFFSLLFGFSVAIFMEQNPPSLFLLYLTRLHFSFF